MSSSKPPKKKVVVTTTSDNKSQGKTVAAAPSVTRKKKNAPEAEALTFGKTNYRWMAIGAGLIALGLILMSGGSMPDPNIWDDNIIYSPRRTVIAPILIVAGLVVEIYAIFVKEKSDESPAVNTQTPS